MTIDGYYVPDVLAESAQLAADKLGKAQHIGLKHAMNTKLEPGLARYQASKRDMAIGRNCTYIYGPSYDELRREHLSVILWLTPRRAA